MGSPCLENKEGRKERKRRRKRREREESREEGKEGLAIRKGSEHTTYMTEGRLRPRIADTLPCLNSVP